MSAEPYCSDTELTTDDTFVLMACDGVWDVMTDEEAMDFVIAKVKAFEEQVAEQKRKGGAMTDAAAAAPAADSNGTAAAAATPAAAAPAASPDAASSSPSPSVPVELSQADLNEVLHLTSKALVREALDRRSLDNVTVLLIKL